jgi:hypothetical protein
MSWFEQGMVGMVPRCMDWDCEWFGNVPRVQIGMVD